MADLALGRWVGESPTGVWVSPAPARALGRAATTWRRGPAAVHGDACMIECVQVGAVVVTLTSRRPGPRSRPPRLAPQQGCLLAADPRPRSRASGRDHPGPNLQPLVAAADLSTSCWLSSSVVERRDSHWAHCSLGASVRLEAELAKMLTLPCREVMLLCFTLASSGYHACCDLIAPSFSIIATFVLTWSGDLYIIVQGGAIGLVISMELLVPFCRECDGVFMIGFLYGVVEYGIAHILTPTVPPNILISFSDKMWELQPLSRQ